MIRLAIRSYILDLSLEEQQDLIGILNQPANVLIKTILLQFNEDGNLYLLENELLKVIDLVKSLEVNQELKNKITAVMELRLEESKKE
jgi:NurA-like 5'-3' nuclease